MKKYFSLSLLFALSVGFVACNGNKSTDRASQVKEFRASLSQADTTEMLQIADQAMEMLKQKQMDKLLESLYEYTDSTQEVKPITDATKKKYRALFSLYPVLEYHRAYYSFQLEGCNDVKYKVVFATAEQAGTDQPAETSFMFNPVKVDGTWKLCVKTPEDKIDTELN